jgi:hypothetical protein
MFVIAMILFLASCENPDNENPKTSGFTNSIDERLVLMKKNLIGSKIDYLRTILEDDMPDDTTPYLLMVYTGYDCNTCIEKSFKIIKYINDFYPEITLFPIGSNTNFNQEYTIYEYDGFIYSDDKEQIRKSLKYLYTPVFLHIKNNVILDVYFVKTVGDAVEQKTFFNSFNIKIPDSFVKD